MNYTNLSLPEFQKLPLLIEGESKEIRQHPEDEDKVVIWLKPTIYSFTHNRTGWVEGSNLLRARALKLLVPMLKRGGVDHAYEEINDETGLIVARKIKPENDPNVETIIKVYNGGTSYYKYYGLHEHPVRLGHPFCPGETFDKYEPFGNPIIRFDWRNPFWHPEKVSRLRESNSDLPEEVYKWPAELRKDIMMRDEVLCEDQANFIIDTKRARRTAMLTYVLLREYMARCQIIIYDLCLFITADGKTVYGEINQDCGRFRHLDHGMLDKDVWRSGGSVGDVLSKWKLLCEMLENPIS